MVRFMLINVNESFFVGFLIQLNQIKAGLFQVEECPKFPHQKVERSEKK